MEAETVKDGMCSFTARWRHAMQPGFHESLAWFCSLVSL